MGVAEIIEHIRALPPKERQEVVDRIEHEFFDDKLTSAEIAEFDRRAEEALAHPERCRPLSEVISDLDKKFRARE